MIAPVSGLVRPNLLRCVIVASIALATGVVSGLHAGPHLARAQSPCAEPRPGWLACEDFELGELGWADWFAASPFTECNGCRDGQNDPARIRLTSDPKLVHSGEWAVEMPAEESAGYQGGALTFRSCLGEKRAGCVLEGYDRLHMRTRVRLAEDHEYVHHFLAIAGTRPDRYWDSDGNAGCRPNGVRWAGTTLDFNADRELFFYTYFPEMRCDSGGYCSGDTVRRICEGCAAKEMPCAAGPECCWGNIFRPDEPVILPRGEWVCLELMMELNTPGEADGRMAFWVDGVLALEQTGMHWRDTPALQLNKAWLMHYIAGGDADQSNQVVFDDMIVSTEYIGCGVAPTATPVAPTSRPSSSETPPATGTEVAAPLHVPRAERP